GHPIAAVSGVPDVGVRHSPPGSSQLTFAESEEAWKPAARSREEPGGVTMRFGTKVRMTMIGTALASAAFVLFAAGIGRVASPGQEPNGVSHEHATVARAFGRVPLAFEPNVGQADRRAIFVAHANGYTAFLTRTGAT